MQTQPKTLPRTVVLDIAWEDPYSKLGGLDRQIAEIKTLIEMPLMSPDIFIQYGLKPPKGVLLYGPPGTGKTSLARAVAAATGSSYLTINGPELSSAFTERPSPSSEASSERQDARALHHHHRRD